MILAFSTGSVLSVWATQALDSSVSKATDDRVGYVTDETFESKVLNSDIPVLVEFTATWCAPCKILDPIIESLMPEMAGRARVYKLDIDESPETFSQFQVHGVPTVLFFNANVEQDRIATPQSKDVYIKYLEGLNAENSTHEIRIGLFNDDSFRRNFLLTQQPSIVEQSMKLSSDLLTREFDNSQTPLSLVLSSHDVVWRKALIDMILNQDPVISPIDLVGLGRCEEFRNLIESNPELVNQPDPDGNTPLLVSLINAHRLVDRGCLWTLLDLGAQPKIPDTSDQSLGRTAVLVRDADLLRELLAKGLNPDEEDTYGRNALHWAAYYGHLESVTALLEHGVERNTRDHSGKTAADIALKKRNEERHKATVRMMTSPRGLVQVPLLTRSSARTPEALYSVARWNWSLKDSSGFENFNKVLELLRQPLSGYE